MFTMKRWSIITGIVIIFCILTCKGQVENKKVDFRTEKRKFVPLNLVPGDVVEYSCPYSLNNDIRNMNGVEREHFDNKQFCFDYIFVGSKLTFLKEYVRGSYNVVHKEEGNLYTSQFSVPPVVLTHRNFDCFCYMEENNVVVKKVLRIHISNGVLRKIPGCDFNADYKESTAITTFSNMSPRRVKVCDVYPKSGDFISLMCPSDYSIKPDGCFSNVYVKRYPNEEVKEEDRFNLNRKWDASKYNVVSIETVLKMNMITQGDKYSIFSKLPDVKDQVDFTCICQSNDEQDNLMMNVYINNTSHLTNNTRSIGVNKHSFSNSEIFERIEREEISFAFSSYLSITLILLYLFFLNF
uniref:Pfs38 n=3 Tax=Plasmodium falciparum TaxID=5833 RepID=A8QVR1_PLAFA|nr:Pfs38 [Plasmodium falciparum]